MKNTSSICWLCQTNLSYPEYEGIKLLDDDGTKPCLECIQEDEQEEEMDYA